MKKYESNLVFNSDVLNTTSKSSSSQTMKVAIAKTFHSSTRTSMVISEKRWKELGADSAK